jgi:hypothetical protein
MENITKYIVKFIKSDTYLNNILKNIRNTKNKNKLKLSNKEKKYLIKIYPI